jgi:hypothetical protein
VVEWTQVDVSLYRSREKMYRTECDVSYSLKQLTQPKKSLVSNLPAMTTDITKDAGYKGVFPSSFLYGCASASYQIEGGWNAEGKGEGVWDRALKDAADNGEDACDSYHLWKDDIKLLKRYGCNTYRFSISWPRVRPQGECLASISGIVLDCKTHSVCLIDYADTQLRRCVGPGE